MKAFNPDKELKKIQKGNRNKILYGIILLLIIISIGSTYALYQVRYSKRIIYTKVAPFSNNDISILAVYVDGVERNSFPSPDEGVTFYKIDCENKTEGYTIADWDDDNWGLNIFSKGPNKCDVEFRLGGTFRYKGTNNYTGEIQTFEAPRDGLYELEVWGAQGGSTTLFKGCEGGLGGYSKGTIYLNKGETLYVVVGGAGTGNDTHASQNGGYNGGGNATSNSDGNSRQSSGGGATHIATSTGLLSGLENNKDSVLIVAGGGGGAGVNAAIMCVNGGFGGGLEAGTGDKYNEGTNTTQGYGGTQTGGGNYSCSSYLAGSGGGSVGSFGKGGSSQYSGAGGGYYGGGVCHASAGGGSGYLSTKLHSETGETTNGVREGNGLAKITLVKEIKFTYKVNGQTKSALPTSDEGYVYSGVSCDSEVTATWDYERWALSIDSGTPSECVVSFETGKSFIYTQSIEEYKVPKTGTYKLEVWGAQGGSSSLKGGCIGGLGGYSKGEISLTEGDTLYIVVGGSGLGSSTHVSLAGGYNGGGNATSDTDGNSRQSSGGGATHIATSTGVLSTFSNKQDDILIVAGGGGGAGANAAIMCTNGGSGGGENGEAGVMYVEGSSKRWQGLGGTQTAGGNPNGKFGQGANAVASGGGGGYYGGGANYTSAGGGSGYLSSKLNSGTTETTNGVREGNGFALITFIK